MRHLYYTIFSVYFLVSCTYKQKPTINKSEKSTEKVKMFYYDKSFSFDTASNLRLGGYYEIREIFGSHTTNGTDYYPNKPTYGYLQFFNDGFCKIGLWNGIFESPSEMRNEIINNKTHGFWGIYKIKDDTLHVEYLFNPVSPGVSQSERRNTLTAVIEPNEIFVTTHSNIKYSFPEVITDSIANSCIGRFMKTNIIYDTSKNFLKRDIAKYQ